ncbi:winged helix DNA-binding domain-containing protein [Kribbella sp. NPDC026596]|uniref:winged helix DNA-binding domain-containing protein n=1 Tax=Kribbella sp. NPDC026596 TaxID=3155122 RepID=UPI0033CD1981
MDWLLAARMQANCLARPVNEAGPGGVADVVRRTGGLQAQTWRGATHAVRARSTATTSADVTHAQEVDRSVIRGWFMRGTLQLVTVEDAGPLLGLLGPKLIKDTERRYGELGLTEAIRAEAADHLEAYLVSHGPSTRAEIADVLVRRGLIVEPKGQAVYALIRHTGLLGRLCYGPGTDTWVAVSEWLGKPLVQERDLDALARRYLTAYGPATAQDFATWSGLAVPIARRGLKAAATVTVEVDGAEFVATEDLPGCRDVRMVGEFDAYLLGYRDRRWALAAEFQQRVYPGGGMLRPAVLEAGRVIGAWKHADHSYELFDRSARMDLTEELADLVRFGG